MSLLLRAALANGAAMQRDLPACSRSVAGIVLAYLGDDGQTKIAEVFVETSWTTLQKLRWFEMGETILIHVSARVDQPEHELGKRCGCGKT
jgi:hypothetical protein